MVQDRYFDKFQVITYSNTYAIDITNRVAVINKFIQNPYVYYPFDITFNERPDQFSYRYYDDPYKSWIVYLSNKIVDPYYEWYMTDTELNEFITKKYGSSHSAYTKIKYYRNDWQQIDPINRSTYDALSPTLKRYWEPNYFGGSIQNYTRVQKDWITNTNRIISYATSNSTSNFILDEVVTIDFDGTHTGTGQILSTSNGVVYVHHTSGWVAPDANNSVSIHANSHVTGSESNASITFTSVTKVVQNLTDEEMVYWKPVYHYDYENEKNEFNKTILVLDNKLAPVAVKNLKDLLKG